MDSWAAFWPQGRVVYLLMIFWCETEHNNIFLFYEAVEVPFNTGTVEYFQPQKTMLHDFITRLISLSDGEISDSSQRE